MMRFKQHYLVSNLLILEKKIYHKSTRYSNLAQKREDKIKLNCLFLSGNSIYVSPCIYDLIVIELYMQKHS